MNGNSTAPRFRARHFDVGRSVRNHCVQVQFTPSIRRRLCGSGADPSPSHTPSRHTNQSRRKLQPDVSPILACTQQYSKLAPTISSMSSSPSPRLNPLLTQQFHAAIERTSRFRPNHPPETTSPTPHIAEHSQQSPQERRRNHPRPPGIQALDQTPDDRATASSAPKMGRLACEFRRQSRPSHTSMHLPQRQFVMTRPSASSTAAPTKLHKTPLPHSPSITMPQYLRHHLSSSNKASST